VASSGDVTDGVITGYVRTQDQAEADDDFRVDQTG